MKKIFTFFLALAASAGTMYAGIVNGTCGENLTWSINTADSTLTISGTGPMRDFNFDGSKSDYPWYGEIILSVKNVVITNGVTSIGNLAFWDFHSLANIIIPNSVTSIGQYAFFRCFSLTSVTIPNSVTSIGDFAFMGCTGMTSPVYNAHIFAFLPTSYSGAYNIPEGIESIAADAFLGCTGLTSVTIPSSVTNIGSMAFLTSVTFLYNFMAFQECDDYCSSLTSVICFATTPPALGDYAFGGHNYYSRSMSMITLYVPKGSIDAYKAADQWKYFGSILPTSAKETETTGVNTTPTENSVDVTWPQVNGAYTYELVIKDKDGNIVCTLIFNAQGKLTSIAFNAPARDEAPQKAQTAGFSFTVTGLKPATEYDLTITAKNENGQELDKKNISFHTNWHTALDDLQVNPDKAIKIIHDGQIHILRGDKTYTLTGQKVK